MVKKTLGKEKAQSSLFVVSFVLALNKAHVLALNTAHVLRLNKADVLALNKAHVLRLNTKTCPVFTANTKEAAFGRLHKGGGLRPPPFVDSFIWVSPWARVRVFELPGQVFHIFITPMCDFS